MTTSLCTDTWHSKKIQIITEAVSRLNQDRDDSERKEILGWLSNADFAAQQESFKRMMQSGTGQWLLNSSEYVAWTERKETTIFCPGIPGAGKTILACTAIESLQRTFCKDNKIGICYAFCNYKRHQEQNVDYFLAGLTKQLVQRIPFLPDGLRSLHANHTRKCSQPSTNEYMELLQDTINCFSTTFLVVDGLDECAVEGQVRTKLLDRIFELQSSFQVQLFATSRFIPEVTKRFDYRYWFEVHAKDEDVQRYLEGHVENLATCVQQNVDLQREICTTIAVSINGMFVTSISFVVLTKDIYRFLLAKLYLDSLRRLRKPRDIRIALEAIKNRKPTDISTALDDAYEKVIDAIEGQQDDTKLAKQILAWITYAKRPLTEIELQHALAVEDDAQYKKEDLIGLQDILTVCHGLLMVDEQTRVVNFVHYTTQEYFEQIGSVWFEDAQTKIAKACVSYLSHDVFATGACAIHQSFQNRLHDHPLFDFASRYWGNYASRGNFEALQLQVLELLNSPNNVASCIQALSYRDYSYRIWALQQPPQPTGLHLAACFGLNLFMRRMLDEESVDADFKDSAERTPLAWAAEKGFEAVVKLLLERDDVEADSKDIVKRTPLSWAAEEGHEAVMKLLLDREDVDINFSNPTPLLLAAENGHEAAVKLLLERNDVVADAEIRTGQTPLALAACYGHVAVVKLLVEHDDVDVNSRDEIESTPLSWAAYHGYEAVVKVLLEKGADINHANFGGWTPLYLALKRHHIEVVKLLLKEGANVFPEISDSRTPLTVAASYGCLEGVKLIIEKGADISAPDSTGSRPLCSAACNGHFKVVELLIVEGADVSAADSRLWTPLYSAAYNGHHEVVDLLLEKGAELISRVGSSGYTSLHYAASNGHLGTLRLFLEKGADIDAIDSNGLTPLCAAAYHYEIRAVKLLFDKGADLGIASSFAASEGRHEVVTLLKEQSTKSNVRRKLVTPYPLCANSRSRMTLL